MGNKEFEQEIAKNKRNQKVELDIALEKINK